MTDAAASERIGAAAETTQMASDAIEHLAGSGWIRSQHLPSFTLRRASQNGRDLAEALNGVLPLITSARLECDVGATGMAVALSDTGERPWILTEPPVGDPLVIFDDEQQAIGRRAISGDLEAALSIEGQWLAEVNVDPARALRLADPAHHWLVVRSAGEFVDLLQTHPWWQLAPLVSPDNPVVVGILGASAELEVETAGMRIEGLASKSAADVAVGWRPQDLSFSRHPFVRNPGPDPRFLIPLPSLTDSADVEPIRRALNRVAVACCWADLASDVYLADGVATLEYFGLQRQSWSIDAIGPDVSQSEAEAVFDLWRSCIVSENPDRVLAVRQVISLLRESPWNKATDIDRASQPLYIAMRGEASAEGLRTVREARALAMSVARETTEATSGLTKSTLERAVAALAAIAAIIVTQSTKTLTMHQAASLRHLLGIGLFVLVPWSYLVEGPTVTQGIESFKTDLPRFSELLTEDDCDKILAAKTYSSARDQARRVRWVVPLVYLVLGVLAFLVS